jgi:hypothetical protein
MGFMAKRLSLTTRPRISSVSGGSRSALFLGLEHTVFLVDTPLAAKDFLLFETLDLSGERIGGGIDGGQEVKVSLLRAHEGAVCVHGDLDHVASHIALGLPAHIDDSVVGHWQIAAQLAQSLGRVLAEAVVDVEMLSPEDYFHTVGCPSGLRFASRNPL